MDKIRFVLHIVDTINLSVARVACYLILAIIGVMAFEVVARYAFNSPTDWGFEGGGYLFFMYILLAGGYSQLLGAHVNCDVIYRKFSLRTKAMVNVITAVLLSFLFCGAILWYGFMYAWDATEIQRHSGTSWNPPVYILAWVLPLGAGLLLIQVLAKFVRDLVTLVTGKEAEI